MSDTQGTITVGTGYRKSGSDELIRNATATKNLTQASASQTVNFKNDIYVTADDFGIVSEGTTPTGSLASGLKISTACYLSPGKDYLLGTNPTGVNFSFVEERGSATYTVVGSPTITDGVASGFSTSNYLKFTTTSLQSINSFELIIHFNSGTFVSGNGHKIIVPYTWSNGVFYLHISGDSGTFQFGNYYNSATHSIEIDTLVANTEYWYKLVFSSSDNVIHAYKSTDSGATWSETSSQADYSMVLAGAEHVIGGGTGGSTEVFKGSVYLYDMSIKVNGSLWYAPYPLMKNIKNTIGWAYDSTVPSTYDLTSQVSKGVSDLFQGQTKAVTNNLYLTNTQTSGSIATSASITSFSPSGTLTGTPRTPITDGTYQYCYFTSDLNVYRTLDGVNWTYYAAKPSLFGSYTPGKLYQSGSRVFFSAGSNRSNRLYYTDNFFTTYAIVDGVPGKTNAVMANGTTKLIVWSDKNIYSSTDNGNTWTQEYTASKEYTDCVAYLNGYFYFCRNDIYTIARASESNIADFTSVMTGGSTNYVRLVGSDGTYLWGFRRQSSTYSLSKSTDGVNWTNVLNIGSGGGAFSNNFLYKAGSYLCLTSYSTNNAYISSDNGSTWTTVTTSGGGSSYNNYPAFFYNNAIRFMSTNGATVIAVSPESTASSFIASATGTPPVGFTNYSNTGKVVTLNNDLTEIVSLT